MPTFRSVLRALPLVVGAFVLACRGDSEPDPDGMGGGGGEGGAPSGAEVTRTLGQDGGELETSNTTLFVPSGALSKNTELKVSDLSRDEIDELPQTSDGVKLTGFPAKFTPHGLSFDQPADVTLSYDPPEDEGVPVVAMKLDNDQDTTWEFVPGGKFETGTASFKIDGFSIYACFEDPNGVAEMLYGPEASGSGGTGSGGAGSGGQGSGGQGVGGTSSGGASGGSGGGSGGSQGGGPSNFGYLSTDTLHGYGFTEAALGATIDSDVETAPAPNCASGTTGTGSESVASLVYSINESTERVQLGALPLSGAGIRIGVLKEVYSQMVVELRGTSSVWCTPFYSETDSTEFLAYEQFDTMYCPGQEYNYDPFDPVNDPIVEIAISVRGNGDYAQSFDYCLLELDTGVPNGYMDGPTWSGHGFVFQDYYSSTTSDLSETPAPNCITGTTGASGSSYAELGYHLNQPAYGGAAESAMVQGTDLSITLLSDIPRDIEVRLSSATVQTTYCSPPLTSTTGTLTIPWTDFVDCSSGAQFNPTAAPLEFISVVVPSSGIANDPFDLCIEELTEVVPID